MCMCGSGCFLVPILCVGGSGEGENGRRLGSSGWGAMCHQGMILWPTWWWVTEVERKCVHVCVWWWWWWGAQWGVVAAVRCTHATRI